MPATKLGPPARKFVTVNDFATIYGKCRSYAYELVAMPEFKEAIFKVGDKKGIRVEINKAHEIMKQLFN